MYVCILTYNRVFDTPAIQSLLDIAKKGMKQRSSIGGPTILDINTGYIRDSLGLENLFAKVHIVQYYAI